MKKIYTTLAVLILTISVLMPQRANAQVPEKMSYQAVIRNPNNNLVQNQQIGMQISIIQGSATGSPVYVEFHNSTTNFNGLVTIEIGGGTVESGNFSTIDWANGLYFIKTETDLAGGIDYTITSTSQLLSVPFALHAKTAETADYNSLSNKPILFDGQYSSLTGTPTLATVAISGSYNDLLNLPTLFSGLYTDLTNKPTLFDGQYSSLTGTPTLATVAISGSYNDLLNRPALFDGSWTSLTNTPTTISGYGITDFDFTGAATNDLLRFNGTRWVRFTPNFALATHVHANATTTVSGFMSGADKTKLNGINGSETEINAGKSITVTGAGTTASPYVVAVNIPHYIGELYGGGVIFYLDDDGEHGLICSMIDINTSSMYSNIATLIGPTAQSDWNGWGNTLAIVTQAGHTASAASLCNGYTNANYGTGTFSDWYLPSIDELSLLFRARYHVSKALDSDGNAATYTLGKFIYWSSTENINGNAWGFNFNDGTTPFHSKAGLCYVRAVRDF